MKAYILTQILLGLIAHFSGGIVAFCAVVLAISIFCAWNFFDAWLFTKV